MQHLTKLELTKLLAHSLVSKRDYTMILMAYSHGLRVSELCDMRLSQIKDGYLTVKRLKGSNKTTQPLVCNSNPLFDERSAVEEWVKIRTTGGIGTGDKVFPDVSRFAVYRFIRKYGLQAGIPEHKLHPHVLKHSIAMHTIKDAGIENVRAYLGHKSIASTGAYLKVDDEAASAAIMGAMK